MVIGLTGTSCAGKNEVASVMESLGFFVIDEDRLGHEALEMNRDRLVSIFGDGILTDGHVDRKKLGSLVFSSSEGLRKLESVSHPWMVAETARLCRDAVSSGRIAVINAAILEKMGLHELCDDVVVVDAPFELRYERARARDGISLEKFRDRCRTQVDIGKKSETLGKNIVKIVNDGDKKQLYRQVRDYCDNIFLLRGSAWASD